MFEGKKTICYWYQRGSNWHFFMGFYEDGELITAHVDNIEVDPIVLWIMDEPVPNSDLSIWSKHLSEDEYRAVHKQNTIGKYDITRLPFANQLTHWYSFT